MHGASAPPAGGYSRTMCSHHQAVADPKRLERFGVQRAETLASFADEVYPVRPGPMVRVKRDGSGEQAAKEEEDRQTEPGGEELLDSHGWLYALAGSPGCGAKFTFGAVSRGAALLSVALGHHLEV